MSNKINDLVLGTCSVLGAFLVIFAVGLTAIRKMLANLPDDHKYKKMCGVLLR